MSDFKVHSDNKAPHPVSRKGPVPQTGDSTQQDKRPPKKDKVTISKKGREKSLQDDQEDNLPESFQESAEGDDEAPEQEKPPQKKKDGGNIVYDKDAQTYTPISELHPKLDVDI